MAISAAMDIDEGGRLDFDGPALRFALRTAARLQNLDLGGGKPVDPATIRDVQQARDTMREIDNVVPLRPVDRGFQAEDVLPNVALDAVMMAAGLPPGFLLASNAQTIMDGATSQRHYASFAASLDLGGEELNHPPPPWVQAFQQIDATWGHLRNLDETGFDPRAPDVQQEAQAYLAQGRTGIIASTQQPSIRLPMPGLSMAA